MFFFVFPTDYTDYTDLFSYLKKKDEICEICEICGRNNLEAFLLRYLNTIKEAIG